MKVSIKCDCLLTEESLKLFLGVLGVKICSISESDFTICDRLMAVAKPLFIIGSDIKIPFTKDELFAALKIFEDNLIRIQNKNLLEERISELTDKFKTDLINLIANAK